MSARRMVDFDIRRSYSEGDRGAGPVRRELQRALHLLDSVPNTGPAQPDEAIGIARAYEALTRLENLLPPVYGFCCVKINRPTWVVTFSAHKRRADADRWLEYWRKEIPTRPWEVRYMPATIEDFRKQGGPPND